MGTVLSFGQCNANYMALVGSKFYVFVNVLLDVHNELVGCGHSILCFCGHWELSVIE